MTSKHSIEGVGIGIASGIVLGVFLKLLQSLTGIKVYVLLLNVDFIPYIGDIQWNEWAEFMFHLIISCLIGFVFVFLIDQIHLSGKEVWVLAFALTLPAFLLYFPLSTLAIKDVPEANDPSGISLWFIGHLVYAVSLPLFYGAVQRSKRKSS
ncbi:hypothetical protein [Rossellomorea sp. NS-SX7]|uniref:hypothetical protein n=1 Tax=Rossellomorea sp. NS-SX7 TaxID=3463856 RepID=UPI004058F766